MTGVFPSVLIFLDHEYWGLEFSSYEIELRNRATQNDVTLRVSNSKIFIYILLLKLNFELLTRGFNFYFSTFDLLTRS